MSENFINIQGKKYNNNKKKENERVNGNIIEPFNNGPVHELNDFEQDEMTIDEQVLLKKKYDLSTKHKTFMEKHNNMLLETRECVKRCQNSKEKQKLTKKEWRVQKRSCLAGCGVYTGALDTQDKFDGTYKNDNGEHEIEKCPILREHAEAPPPTKIVGDKCASSKECFSFKCGGSNGGVCKGKCYVEGKSSPSLGELFDGEGSMKTFCGENVSRLVPNKLYNFYFRTGSTWNLIEGFHTTLSPIKFCKSIKKDDIDSILNVYGIRCYGVLHKIGSKNVALLEDPNNGIPKPSWNRIKSQLVGAGGKEGNGGLVPVKNMGWSPSKLARGQGDVGEGDADRNRDCKSGKVVHDPRTLEKYGLTGNKRRYMDYCIGGGDKVSFDTKGALWKQIGGLLSWCLKDDCDNCFTKEKGQDPLALSRYVNTKMYGWWIGWYRGIKVEKVDMLSNGWIVLIAQQGRYTKMVAYDPKRTRSSYTYYWIPRYQQARYFVGKPSQYKRSNWKKYRIAKIWGRYSPYIAYNLPKRMSQKEKNRKYASLNKCAYEKPDFPYTLLLNLINPKYVDSDYAMGTWHWWPNYRGVDQWPGWWGSNWLDGLGVVWGNWNYPGASFQGKGKSGAERACNQSEDCVGFFESNRNQYHMIFPGSGKYKSSGTGKNVKNIYLKDGSNIPKPTNSGKSRREPTSKNPRWWWSWYYSTPEGRRQSEKPLSKGYCGSKGSLDKYVGRVDSVGQCAAKCKTQKKVYAGVTGGQYCYCGNMYWKGGNKKDCSKKCRNGGNCGGSQGVNMYYSGYRGTGGSSLEHLDGPPNGSGGRQFSKAGVAKPKDKGVCPADQSYIEFFSNQKDKKKDYSHLKIMAGIGGIAGAYYLSQK